jgi:hypothetical protein
MDKKDHYVVRIYRRTQDPASLTGIVEHPGTGERAAFHDIQGLRLALSWRPPMWPAKPKKPVPTEK